MAVKIPASIANGMLDTTYGTPADGGKVRVYSGAQPAAGGGALSGNTLLLEFQLQADAFPAASGAVLTANAVGAAVGLAVGTAAWWRLVKSNGTTVVLDGECGLSGSGKELILDSVDVETGDPVAMVSLTISQPLG